MTLLGNNSGIDVPGSSLESVSSSSKKRIARPSKKSQKERGRQLFGSRGSVTVDNPSAHIELTNLKNSAASSSVSSSTFPAEWKQNELSVSPTLPKHHSRASTRLPGDWQKHTDTTGRRYYSNNSTQESSWVAPEGSIGGSASANDESVSSYSNPMKKTKAKKDATTGALKKKHHTRHSTKLPPDWNKHNDDQGKRYYTNNSTQESSWTPPPGSTGGSSSM